MQLRIADQLEGDQDLRRKVKSAMTYPTVVLIMAILAATVMLIFIVPIFAQMFESLGGTLPLPTRIAMGLSDLLIGIGGLFAGTLLVGGTYFFSKWKSTEQGVRSGTRSC